MRTLLLLSLLCLAAAGADAPLQPLAPTQELPYCAVLVDMGKDDAGRTVQPEWHQGFYYAPLHQMLAGDPKADLLAPQPYTNVLKVVPAARQPFPTPEYVRRTINDRIAQHNREQKKEAANAPAP